MFTIPNLLSAFGTIRAKTLGVADCSFLCLQMKISCCNNHRQNIWDKVYFSCEIGQFGESSISIFQFPISCWYWKKKNHFRRRTKHWTTIQWSFEIFLILPDFPGSHSTSFGSSYNIPCLSLTIKLRFTCAERKFGKTSKIFKTSKILKILSKRSSALSLLDGFCSDSVEFRFCFQCWRLNN